MKQIVISALLSGLAVLAGASAGHAETVDAYAATPLDAYPELSPNGRWMATHCTQPTGIAACVYDLNANALVHIIPTPEETSLDEVYFASDDFVVASFSSYNTFNTSEGLKSYLFSRSFSLNLETGEVAFLATNLRGSTNTTNIVSLDIDDPETVLMEMNVYTGAEGRASSGFVSRLYSVNLRSGNARRLGRSEQILRHVVNATGEVVAEVIFQESTSTYQVREPGRDGRVIYSGEHVSDAPSILGFVDETDFVAYFPNEEGGYRRIDRNTGEISEFDVANLDVVSQPIWDSRRQVVGFRGIRDGLSAQYFFDDQLRADAQALETALGAPVLIEAFTPDRNMLLLSLSQTAQPPTYYLYERSAGSVAIVAQSYPQLSAAPLPQRQLYRYQASDGLEIEGILTTPPGWSEADGALPLIVLPHGGPLSRDILGFDWWSQAYASQGYMVLQPNFRGSVGYGVDFTHAGYGEFGDRMVTDSLDGGRALQAAGMASGETFCVAGASYGGYAALRAAILAPEDVACVVAFAPVTDPVTLLGNARRSGRGVFAYDFWEQYIGDIYFDREASERISIHRNAEAISAPVLLIHGEKDAVVPIGSSLAVQRNMSRDQQLEFIELEGENHFLHLGQSRRVLLERSLALFEETLR